MAIIEPIDFDKIVVQPLWDFVANAQDCAVSMMRLDAMHPVISGNKWYKLRYNIAAAKEANSNLLLSFGGAFSNHLIATAAAANTAELRSVGIVRGEENALQPNNVLQQCAALGMELKFITRKEYAQKEDAVFLKGIKKQYPDAFVIPEGGDNLLGQKGAGDIAQYISKDFTHIILSVGTATTFIGLRKVLPNTQQLIGFAPMKGGIYLKEKINAALSNTQNRNWDVTDRFHFGGFGKSNTELASWMIDFEQKQGFALDRVYTAKMMYGLANLINEAYFAKGANILCIHTGGLSGN